MREKLYDKFLFNFLASDRDNAAAVMEAGSGYVVPGIVSDKFDSIETAAEKVAELKSVTDMVSIGLGGGEIQLIGRKY
ncbi:KDGP aldolase [Paracerasibacillus soli]|uniref:KDGP aldolase n=1 Tax=Paracerasibacillus soli TaxID=480284 RepID=A0ABU5CSD0_9BACI|nr:KDGP aldolase [Virgibacillus soli]MDY0409275.1 KDGP aldolase [Virgibacillus soli]